MFYKHALSSINIFWFNFSFYYYFFFIYLFIFFLNLRFLFNFFFIFFFYFFIFFFFKFFLLNLVKDVPCSFKGFLQLGFLHLWCTLYLFFFWLHTPPPPFFCDLKKTYRKAYYFLPVASSWLQMLPRCDDVTQWCQVAFAYAENRSDDKHLIKMGFRQEIGKINN